MSSRSLLVLLTVVFILCKSAVGDTSYRVRKPPKDEEGNYSQDDSVMGSAVGDTSHRVRKPPRDEEGNYNQDDSVMGTIRKGFKAARKFLGLDTASGVANLVAEAFGESKTSAPLSAPDQENTWGKTLLSGLVKALSLDSGKIGAIVLNAIIFLAQLLTTSLVPKNPELESPRKNRDGSPIEWILKNPSDSIKDLILVAEDEYLMDHMIETLKENSKEKDTSCLQLLMCKMAPFVWRMQRVLTKLKSKYETKTNIDESNKNITENLNKTLGDLHNSDNINEGSTVRRNDKDVSNNGEALFRHLPDLREFVEHGQKCEVKYDDCKLLID